MTRVASFFVMRPTRIDLRDADMRIHAETSPAGCAIMMHVARIASVVGDFPRSVTIAEGDAHLRVHRGAHGVWGLAGSDAGLLEVIESRTPTSFASAVSLCLDAMGCINTHEARARAASLTAWPGNDGVADALRAIKGTVHPHVLATAVGHAEDIVPGIVSDWSELRATLATWTQILTLELGKAPIELAVSRTVTSPVAIAAAAGRAETIKTLSRMDVNLDVPMPAHHALAGHTPASLALRAGKLDAASVLLRSGADASAVADDGETLMHSAARGIVSHAIAEDAAVEIFATLAISNVDAHTVNAEGETAMDILGAAEPGLQSALSRYLAPSTRP